MALITAFRQNQKISPRWRSETECGFRVASVDGRRVVSLVTYGSSDRQVPGKGSQYLQLDESTAGALVQILREAFPSIS